MKPIDYETRKKLRELANNATPGPWNLEKGEHICEFSEEDAKYMSTLSPDVVLNLLDNLEQTEKWAQEMQDYANSTAAKFHEHCAGCKHTRIEELEKELVETKKAVLSPEQKQAIVDDYNDLACEYAKANDQIDVLKEKNRLLVNEWNRSNAYMAKEHEKYAAGLAECERLRGSILAAFNAGVRPDIHAALRIRYERAVAQGAAAAEAARREERRDAVAWLREHAKTYPVVRGDGKTSQQIGHETWEEAADALESELHIRAPASSPVPAAPAFASPGRRTCGVRRDPTYASTCGLEPEHKGPHDDATGTTWWSAPAAPEAARGEEDDPVDALIETWVHRYGKEFAWGGPNARGKLAKLVRAERARVVKDVADFVESTQEENNILFANRIRDKYNLGRK